MKIRFLNTYEPVTTFYRDLLPYLAEQGMCSEVLLCAAEYRQGGRGKLSDTLPGHNLRVRYLPVFGMQPSSRWQKTGIMLTYILESMAVTLFGKGVNINFFLTQPPLFCLWGWILKVLRRQPYLCLVMDIYPDVAIMDGILSGNGFVTRLLSNLNSFALRHADAVVVIGRCMAERIRAMGIPADRIHFIPNWANTDLIYPVLPEKNQLRKALGLQNKCVVLYSGNMGVSHDFSDILEVARLSQDQTELHFVFIGDGQRRKEVGNFVNDHNLPNVTLLPFQPLENLAESLSLGDIHFVSLRQGFEGLVVPSKIYGALASGRPVIYSGDAKGEIARLLNDYATGRVVPPGDVNALHQAIMLYVGDPDLRAVEGERARRVAVNEMGKERALRHYTDLLQHIYKERIWIKNISQS